MILATSTFGRKFFTTLAAVILSVTSLHAQRQLTFEDVMKFEDIKTPVISANGEWVAFGVWPEIGDGEVRIQSAEGGEPFILERGQRPQISRNGEWAGALVKPPYLEAENAGKNAPKQRLTLMQTAGGDTTGFANVRSFSFSNDSRWALVHHHQTKDVEEGEFKNSRIGTPVTLFDLGSGTGTGLSFVHEAVFDSTANWLVYSAADTSGNENGLYKVDLKGSERAPQRIAGSEHSLFSNLTWNHSAGRIAFTVSVIDTSNQYLPGDADLFVWDLESPEPELLVAAGEINEGYRLRSRNRLAWSRDGKRLFYGVQDAGMVAAEENKTEKDSLTTENMYDAERILKEIEGDVWHWDDPLIKPQEKQTWNRRKNHLYTAVCHLDEGRSVQLATKELPDVNVSHNAGKLLGSSDLPYQKLITWDGRYRDYYLIDPGTGEAEQFLTQQRFGAALSPNGRYAAWFDGTDWNIRDIPNGEIKNLTSSIGVPFADEDNDRPQPSGSYGIAGWTDDDDAVLIYDKYDIWQFDTGSGEFFSVTDGKGREENRIFRIRNLPPDEETFDPEETLLLTMYHDQNKNFGFYEARTGRAGVTRLLEEEKKFSITALAEDDDAILFTQETYQEYPNLWVAEDHRFRNPVQVSDLHTGLTDTYAWGHAELIDWLNVDGETVQGVLIYPGDYDPEERYPVFIYYYERYSQRLYDFDVPVTNHRPNLAQYTSDGYAVFLPDVWYDIPVPGYSATKNLVPGVQKLVEMGVADPDAIGLHGHSWSGYQTAFVVTQTDIFAAAVAGAPVSNMTSAYGGIRWGSGMARQFQYEQTQSRLGVSLWENMNPYIENSPLFYADRINTPLMLQHGDADDAVPWYQSIELYLALRRLGKESVFLHYYGEPHHLRKYANRLDYAIKMKEYMDHYLKGEAAPAWITDGVPYTPAD